MLGFSQCFSNVILLPSVFIYLFWECSSPAVSHVLWTTFFLSLFLGFSPCLLSSSLFLCCVKSVLCLFILLGVLAASWICGTKVFHQFWNTLVYYLFNCCFCSIVFLITSRDSNYTCIGLFKSHLYSQLCFSFLLRFPFISLL